MAEIKVDQRRATGARRGSGIKLGWLIPLLVAVAIAAVFYTRARTRSSHDTVPAASGTAPAQR